MNDNMNVFVMESNVELFLSMVYKSTNAEERDSLLRLIADEQTRMGQRREHLQNAHRRLDDCKMRARQQRQVISALPEENPARQREVFLLETLEKILLLVEEHQRALAERLRESKP
jgi:hypothetical protein